MAKRSLGPGAVLAGDIGGTKTRLGLFSAKGKDHRPIIRRTYQSAEHPDLESIIKGFLQGHAPVAAACFGVAGPVVGGAAIATNLPWTMEERRLSRALGTKRVELINDLVANAYGVRTLQRKDLVALNRARPGTGNGAMLSAGTGLGAAVLFWNGSEHVPLPSEGGHVEFGPRNGLELELLEYLFDHFGHVSYERVLSGAGIYNIYRFLRDSGRFGREPRWLGERIATGDPAAVITEAAQERRSALCARTLDLFCSIYGAAAGNLALQVMAVAGVFIGGGIAPKIIGKLRNGTFMTAFRSKGRLSRIVEQIPVKVVMNDQAALLGAAFRCRELLKR